MADEAFQNLVKALCVLAAQRDNLNNRVDAATQQISDYLARSANREGDLEGVRKAVRIGAETANDQRPNQVAFWTDVLGSLDLPSPSVNWLRYPTLTKPNRKSDKISVRILN